MWPVRDGAGVSPPLPPGSKAVFPTWGLVSGFPWFLGWINEEGAVLHRSPWLPTPPLPQDRRQGSGACAGSRSLDAGAARAWRGSPVHKLPLMETRDKWLELQPAAPSQRETLGRARPARLDPAPRSRPALRFERAAA